MTQHSSIGSSRPSRIAIVHLLLVGLVLSGLSIIDDRRATAQEADSAQQSEAVDPGSRTEVVDLRSETTKVFEEPDGSHTAEIYAGPIHYREDGAWEQIDNTLVPSSRPGYAYENKANSYKLYVPENVQGAPIRIETDKGWVEFQLQGATAPATVSGNTVTYNDVSPGVDLAYEAKATGVEESLVLASPQTVLPEAPVEDETPDVEEPQAAEPFVFSIDTSGELSMDEVASGGIELEAAGGKVVAEIEPPFAFEASEGEQSATTQAVDFELTETGSQTTLALVPDAEWLLDPARDWPVVIDPTTTVNPTRDCWIGNGSEANSSNCGATSDYIRVGRTGGGDKRRGLLQFDLPSIPANTYVSSADLKLYLDDTQTTNPGNAADYVLRRMTRDWSSASWNKYDGQNNWDTAGGDFGTTSFGRINLGGSTSGYKAFTATGLVRSWLDGTYPNEGFILKQDSPENTNNVLYFFSSDSADTGKWPKLVVPYGRASLDVTSWDRDVETGTAAYTFTAGASGLAVEGGPCDGVTCHYRVEGYRRDGSTDQLVTIFADESLAENTTSFSTPFTGSLSREITDLKVEVYATCSPCSEGHERYEAWMHVSDPYPDGEVYLAINSWERDEDGEVSYDLSVSAVGAAQEDGPCQSSCYSKVYYREDDSQPAFDLASADHPTRTWSFTDVFSGTTSADVGEIKATVNACTGCSGEGYTTGWVPVPSGVDLVPYEAALAGAYATMSPLDFCAPLLYRGFGSTDGDTLPDIYQRCMFLLGTGTTLAFLLSELLVEEVGEEALDALVEDHEAGEPVPSQVEQQYPPPKWTPPPGWQDNGCNWIIPEDSIELAATKIEENHVWGAGKRKSEFYRRVSWRWLARWHAEKEAPRPSIWPWSKYCVRRVEFARRVGIERIKGREIGPTNVYTVLTFKTGELYNMYPGEPAEDR